MKRSFKTMPKININCFSTCCKSTSTHQPPGNDTPLELMCCVKIWTNKEAEEKTEKKNSIKNN